MTQLDSDDEEDVPEWADRVKATVAGEVRRRRKAMGWSAQDLADRIAQLGHPIPRNVIANMESGRRATLPLVDVLVLAAALETYPLCLIFPVGYVERVQELPLQELVPTWEALQRFTGEEEVSTHDFGLVPDFDYHASLVRDALASAEESDSFRFTARTATSRAQREKAERKHNDCEDRLIAAKSQLRSLRHEIRESGAVPPSLPHALQDVEPPEHTVLPSSDGPPER
ncbi:helix-turn-helix domain-containing protein [Streptomyces aculeolatus]|uniref:helix-turn-helix domain-containing protein n=1 Tax=Streptomyces aculeolatus TaxID=270689 RepID=UPI0035573773